MSLIPAGDSIFQILLLISFIIFIYSAILIIRTFYAVKKIEQKLGLKPEKTAIVTSETSFVRCKYCGKDIPKGNFTFCPFCGNSLSQTVIKQTPPSPT